MDASVEPAAGQTSTAPSGRRRGVVGGLLVLAGVGIVALSMWLVGPTPASVDAGFPTSPPPLALPSDTPEDSALARAAAQLASGDLDAARASFIDLVAEAPNDVAGQVGLVLSRWRTTGPRSVERDLFQLTREYPESAHAALHLGLVQLLLNDDRAARATLRDALEAGRSAGDPTSLRMARLADDLLHPGMFRGPLPVLVAVSEVRAADRANLRELLAAVGKDDRVAMMGAARRLERSSDPMARVAAISSTFDKQDPEAVPMRLGALARDDVPVAVRDRARFLATLAKLWSGEDRDAGCRALATSAGASADPATQRYAKPIYAELCTSGASSGSKD